VFIEAFEGALAKRASDPRSAIDDLSLLRVRALQSAPEFAEALSESIDLLQRGRPAEQALARARKTLQPPRPNKLTPPEWGGG
jgi:hypothetical protein